MFFDLNALKSINDSYVNLVGGQLWVEISRELHLFIIAGDSVTRDEGDVFLLLHK